MICNRTFVNIFRQTTARFAPINYSSLKTTYQQEFRDKVPIGKPLVFPCSRHRKNKPHSSLTNTWNYPNSVSYTFKSKREQNGFATGSSQACPHDGTMFFYQGRYFVDVILSRLSQ